MYTFTIDDINKINLSCFNDMITEQYEIEEFNSNCGKEHYKLLAYLSTYFNNQNIIDIGTHKGKSSLALSYNKSNTILSFDIVDCVTNHKMKNRNVEFILEDLWNEDVRSKWLNTILQSPLIFLDVDPHNGTMEYDFFLFLYKNNYQGIVLCDDIWFFKEMRDNFWYKIPDEYKYDMTKFGHWSGTGIFSFKHKFKKNEETLTNWTLLTAYFDLTKCSDASDEIKARDQNHYLNVNGISTLCLPYNLVIYCDNESFDKIYNIRPEYLRDKTHYVICNFEEFQLVLNQKNFTELREQIIINRKGHNIDKRNTASYLLFCLSRYIMLQKTILHNPFNSSHFAWINICIERMGYRNLITLSEALSCNRDKFSTCHIDYRDKELVNNYSEYFKYGGLCGMCSGFFTGNKHYMFQFCNYLLEKATNVINSGYGHADEQFFSQVFFDHPEIFDNYYGDYFQMITNYKYIHEKAEEPIKLIITNSYLSKDYDVCLKACNFVMNSYILGKCSLSDENVKKLGYYLINSKKNKDICADTQV
jgi:predicted O-methyltransferase YrrM